MTMNIQAKGNPTEPNLRLLWAVDGDGGIVEVHPWAAFIAKHAGVLGDHFGRVRSDEAVRNDGIWEARLS